MPDPKPHDEEEIPKASHAEICVALDRLIAAQDAAMRASQLLAEERNRYPLRLFDTPSRWSRAQGILSLFGTEYRIRRGINAGLAGSVALFAALVIVRIALDAWNSP
jgi:hypothetical protein